MIYNHGEESWNATRAAQACRLVKSYCSIIATDYPASLICEKSSRFTAAVALAAKVLVNIDCNKDKSRFARKV